VLRGLQFCVRVDFLIPSLCGGLLKVSPGSFTFFYF